MQNELDWAKLETLVGEWGMYFIRHSIKYNPPYDPTQSEINNKILLWAARFGSIAVFEYIATLSGVDPVVQYRGAITYAAQTGRLDLIKYLVTLPGVDPTEYNLQAVKDAIKNNHLPVVEFFLEWEETGQIVEIDPTKFIKEPARPKGKPIGQSAAEVISRWKDLISAAKKVHPPSDDIAINE